MGRVKYLLDTNILSEPLASRPHPSVMDRLEAFDGQLATSVTTWHEMLFGMRRLPASRRLEQVRRYLLDVVRGSIPILPYDTAAAEWHADERARLVDGGLTPPFADGQIAAVAAVNGLVLVTRNTRDFENFRGLDLENWFASGA